MGKTRGFTLIELMVTIAVLAVIAMMATPKMSEMIAKQNLILTARDLSSTLNEARSKAVLTRRNVTVTFNDTTKSSKDNTDTQMFWLAKTGNALTASSPTSIIFTSYGLVKDATDDSDLVVCNTSLHITKTISVSKIGTIVGKSDGSCE